MPLSRAEVACTLLPLRSDACSTDALEFVLLATCRIQHANCMECRRARRHGMIKVPTHASGMLSLILASPGINQMRSMILSHHRRCMTSLCW